MEQRLEGGKEEHHGVDPRVSVDRLDEDGVDRLDEDEDLPDGVN